MTFLQPNDIMSANITNDAPWSHGDTLDTLFNLVTTWENNVKLVDMVHVTKVHSKQMEDYWYVWQAVQGDIDVGPIYI